MEIAKSETVKRISPANLASKDEWLFKSEFKRSFEKVNIKYLEKVLIFSNGVIFKKSFLWNLNFNKNLNKIKLVKPFLKTIFSVFKSRKIVKITYGIIITDNNSDGFFHWFADVLQKMEALNDSKIDSSKYLVIIPYRYNKSFSKITLKSYKFGAIFLKKHEIAYIKNAIYIPLISTSGNYRPNLMNSLRNRFKILDNKKNQRIYISRLKAKKRKLINEDFIIKELIKNKFKIVYAEDLSFIQQYKLFSNCEILISIHGAGLTHMLFMPEKSKVMEIRLDNDCHNNCYYSFASVLGHQYYYCLANASDSKKTQKTNFYIEVENFKSAFKSLLIDSN